MMGSARDSADGGRAACSRWQLFGLVTAVPVLVVLLLLPTPAAMTPAAHRAGAVCVLMVVLWVTEAIPIAATALLPLALFPALQIVKAGEVASCYGDKNIFLFMGGFFMAVTMEKWNLHRRIALRIISMLGTSPRRIVLGFMVATAFLSMWISNTATTMMMLPISMAIIFQYGQFVQEAGESESAGNNGLSDFNQSLMLSIAFSASIGGIATLIGTPPNIVFAASFKKLFPAAPEISFVQWFMVGFPLVAVLLPIAWLYMTRMAFKVQAAPLPMGREAIRSELSKLGRMARGEKLALFYFVLLALGWIFRRNLDLGALTVPGWSNLLGVESHVHDSTVAILVAVLLFVTPVEIRKNRFLLDWESAVRIPWGILILFGGGLALADGFARTGLAQWIASNLGVLQSVPTVVMLFLVAVMMILLTEVTSNTAVATIFMPILAATAVGMKINPIILMMVGTIAASLAFMLPVATPPNAIVFGSGHVRLPVMARVGFGLDLIGIVLVLIVLYTVAIPVLGLESSALPDWAG